MAATSMLTTAKLPLPSPKSPRPRFPSSSLLPHSYPYPRTPTLTSHAALFPLKTGFLPYDLILTRTNRFPFFSPFCSTSDSDFPSHPLELEPTNTPAIQQPQPHPKNGCLDGYNGAVTSHINGIDDKLGVAPTSTSQSKDVKHELMMLSLPAIGGQAIEPLVQLMETAFIGRLGTLELASAGVSISVFNIISKLFNIPLMSVTTSFVAEDISKNTHRFSTVEKLQLSSVSSALLLAVAIGIFEAMALSFGSGPLLRLMGISTGSSMHAPAQRFLILRALGAPAFVVSLALQGIFRGFKDSKTPVYCLGYGNFTAIFLFPLFMYFCQLGVYGAAISSVISQYIVAISMIWNLNKRAVLLPPKLEELDFGSYLKSGDGYLLFIYFGVYLLIVGEFF